MTTPTVAAMMMVRNEADMVAESLRSLIAWGVTRIVVQDGNSTDGTFEIVKGEAAGHGVEIDLFREPPAERFREDRRMLMYDRLRANWSPDWVMSVDADEVYLTDPLEAIRIADADGAWAVLPFIPQFCLTVADLRNGALVENPATPYRLRRRWYAWGWREMHIWRENPALRYWPDEERGVHRDPTLPGDKAYRYLWSGRSARCEQLGIPVQGHYPFRSVAQGVAKQADRLPRGGVYFGACAESWIVDEQYCCLRWWDGDPQDFVRSENHHLLREWYAEARRRAEEEELDG